MGDNRDRINYKEIYLLILSLLQGSLFFVLIDNVNIFKKKVDVYTISFYILACIIFFRIFQSQMLAALKYDEKWDFKALDFVVVFIFAMFEYYLFDFIGRTANLQKIYLFIIVFALMGAVGFWYTLKSLKKKYQPRERELQILNIAITLLIAIIAVVGYLIDCYTLHIVVNVIIVLVLSLNIYISFCMSGLTKNRRN